MGSGNLGGNGEENGGRVLCSANSGRFGKMPNSRCFIDVSVEGQLIGRVVFELFNDLVPKTVEKYLPSPSTCAALSLTPRRGVTVSERSASAQPE